jgi:lipopolysaccharide biosynthesis regulator YciM
MSGVTGSIFAAAPQEGWGAWILVVAVIGVLALMGALWQKQQAARKRALRDPYTEGLNLMLIGRFSEAVEALTKAAAANTGNLDAYIKVGSLYRKLGKPRRAAQIHLELSIRTGITKPLKAAIYRELALDLEEMGNLERAFKCLQSSRDLDPNNPDDLEIKLRLIEKQGRWSDASETLKKMNSIRGKADNPRLAMYKIQEGEALNETDKGHEARICYKEALKIDPDSAEAMLYIAASYGREGRENDAFEWISKFISEFPDRAELAIPMLQSLLYEAGRFSEIEPILRKALEKAPENRYLRLALADLLMKKGEYDEALELCERSLESGSGESALRLYRLQILRRKGENRLLDRGLEEMLAQVAPYGHGYFCSHCGFHSDRLRNRCPNCGKWRNFYGDRRTITGRSG